MDMAKRQILIDFQGEKFKDLFFLSMDQYRDEVYRFFGPNAVMAYNGKTYNGPEAIAQFMKNLAPTKHDVFTLNVHEVPPVNEQKDPGKTRLLVTVTGNVTYAMDPPTPFYLTAYLDQSGNGMHFVTNMTFREAPSAS